MSCQFYHLCKYNISGLAITHLTHLGFDVSEIIEMLGQPTLLNFCSACGDRYGFSDPKHVAGADPGEGHGGQLPSPFQS